MKLLMGFIIILVALVAVTGCTQTASPSAQTTTETTAPVTEVTTAATTATTVAPSMTETMVTNVTAPAENVTSTAVMTTAAPANVTPTVTPASMVTTIHFTSAGFTPQTDIVLPGTGVSFVNNDIVSHSVMTIGNNTGVFNSGAIMPNGAFQYTFDENSGTYNYALADNTSVTGTIIVQASPYANHS
ncbi:MAG: hypothetical protein WB759_08570 [Methanoregula sp.]